MTSDPSEKPVQQSGTPNSPDDAQASTSHTPTDPTQQRAESAQEDARQAQQDARQDDATGSTPPTPARPAASGPLARFAARVGGKSDSSSSTPSAAKPTISPSPQQTGGAQAPPPAEARTAEERPASEPRSADTPAPASPESHSTRAASAESAQQPQGEQPQTDAQAPEQQQPEQQQPEQTSQKQASKPVPPPRRGAVPLPSRRGPLSDDLEQEIRDALGDESIEQMIGEQAASGQTLDLESRQQATVVKLHRDNVFFSLGGRNEGVASVRQFEEPPEVGTQMEVIVSAYNTEDGLYELAIPGASIDVSDWSDLHEGAIVEARVTGSNTGGLECMVNNLRGFIPASQVALYRVEDFSDFVDQKLLCVVTEADARQKNLVLSRRAVLEREKEEARGKLMDELEVGQVREGVVRNLRDFGAFVDLGGVDGMIHVSQLSWERVKHPKDVLEEGQRVKVKVEKIDRATGRIGLSYRDLIDHPWKNIESEFTAGSVVTGTVSRTADFGAFVKLAPGVEGLVHISELAHQRVRHVTGVVREGQEVQVKILSIDPDAQRISLSLKATQQGPEEAKAEAEEESGEARELAVPRRKGPLKGGTDRPSGGDAFGLKW